MGVMESVHELRLCGVCLRRLPERGAEPAYCRQELSQLFHKYGLKHFYKSCAECYTNVQSALKLMEETRRAQIILRKIRIHQGKIRSNIELKTKIKGWISRHRREHLKKQVNSCTHRCVQCEGSDDGGSSDVEEVHTVIKQEPIEYCEVEQNNDRIVNKAEVAIKVERDALTEGKTSPDNIFCETENPPSPIMFVEVELTDHVKNEPATAVDPASSVKEQFSEGKNYNNEQNATVSMYTKRQEEEEDNEGSESKREESADFGPDDNATVMESGCEIPASVLTLVECIKISERERLAELESKRQRDSFQNAMYKCDKCGLGFRFQETLDRHMKQHSKKYGEHYCEMCDLYFQRREVLALHRARHYTRYRCTLCPFVKMEKRACVMHCIQQHYDLQFKCDQCPKHFRKPYALMRHVKSVHATSNEQLQCPLCDKWLKSNHAYRTHIENHTRSTAYHACTKCHKRFASAPLLAAHLHQCAESRGVCCEHCGLVVKSKYILTTHMERKHSGGNGSDSRFVCDLCGRSFLNKADMRTHITWVHMRRGLKCPHCDKSFRSNCTRKRHIQKVHEKQEAVKDKFCDVCGKGFATNSTLKIHRRSHTGERPYKCSKCTQTFAQSGTMWTHHRLVHEKAKWKDLIQKRRKCDE